jgi:hypothetical protein
VYEASASSGQEQPSPPVSLPAEPPAPSPAPVPRRHDLLAVASLVLLSSLFFGDVLIGINNFYMRDLTRYYYPTKKVLREIVYGGEFPYWNRNFSAGQPMAANPEHEVFYPLTWLILLPSYDFGYRLHILVHIWIGLAGMYALLRSMELRPPSALFGAVAFGLGGIYLSYINLLPILFCAAWLPLTCLYVRRFLLHRRARDFALAALILGLQFLVAEPTTVMQTGFLIGMYALYRGWYSERRLRSMIVNVGIIAAISVCAFAVGAAQMLSGIDHAADSIRARGFDFDLVKAWSMPWAKLAELIYPNVLGHIAVKKVMWYWAGGLYPGMGSPFLFSIYPGLAVMALAVGGALMRPRGGRFVLILIVFSVVIALGGHTPLLKFLYDLGIATSIRYPEKFVLIAVFAITVFAAQMLQRLLDGDDELRDAAAGFALATAVVALAVVVMSYTKLGAATFMKIWSLDAKNKGSIFMANLAWDDWKIATVRGALLLVLILTVRTRWRWIWLSAGAVFLMADLGVVVHELNPRMPRRFFTEAPEVAGSLPANRRDFRVFHEIDWYGQEKPARQYFSTGNAVYWVVRNGLYPMTTVGHGLALVLERDYDKTTLLPTVDLIDSVWDVKRSGRADWADIGMSMSNAWYRAVYRNFESERKRTGGDFKKAHPLDFKEHAHYPRYYFADEVVQIRDRKEFVHKLTKETHSRRTAFITGTPFKPAAGRVLRATESSNDATIEVEASGRSFLVMSVTPHKYWRVLVDGRQVRAVVTNIGYQGIVVPAGPHVVTMRYRNTLIRAGSVVSGLTSLALLVFVFRRRPVEGS